jgi:hypothetical protein
MFCCSRRRVVRLAFPPVRAVSPECTPPLGLPGTQTMLNEDTHCISLATFSSACQLQEYLDAFSRSEKKAKVNAVDKNGTTPLLAACRRDAVTHVQILIACGADVGKASLNGWTPLMLARSPKIRKMLQATEGQSGYVEPGQRAIIFFD